MNLSAKLDRLARALEEGRRAEASAAARDLRAEAEASGAEPADFLPFDPDRPLAAAEWLRYQAGLHFGLTPPGVNWPLVRAVLNHIEGER